MLNTKHWSACLLVPRAPCDCSVPLLPPPSGQCGLWVDEYLHRGSSSPCQTFDNECLATEPDFAILGVEVWCLVS